MLGDVDMGTQYKLIPDPPDPARIYGIGQFLRTSSMFHSYDSEHSLFNLRMPGGPTSEVQHDAQVLIDPDAIWFCDTGARSDCAGQLLRLLIDELLRHSSKVLVERP